MKVARNRSEQKSFATYMITAVCLMATSACGAVRASPIRETDTLPDDVSVAMSWSQPDDPIANREGFLTLDGDTTHELKELNNAPRFTKTSSDSDGNIAFVDFSNLYVMGRSGTKIIPRRDPFVSQAAFTQPYPLGSGDFAFLSNYGVDPSNPDGYIFLLEFTDGTSMHVQHWVSDITMCQNHIYGLASTENADRPGIQLFRIDQQPRKTIDIGPVLTTRWGLHPESGLACHGTNLVVRLGASSWNKRATYPQTALAFFDLNTGSARQIPITDENGNPLNEIDGGEVRQDSSGGGSDAVIVGADFIWTLLTGQVVATDLTTGKSHLVMNTHLTPSEAHPARIQGKTVGIVDTTTGSPVIRLYDLDTGTMVKEVEPLAAKQAQERSGGLFTSLTLSGFAVAPPP